ncbi:hypothetical protein V6N13_091574 [Hibiscus sabdariffa]
MLDKAKSPREQRSSQTQSVHAAIVRTRRLTLPKGWLLLDRKYFNRCVSKTANARKEAFPATCEKDKLQSKLALGNAPGARLTNLYFAAWNSSSKLYCKS